MEYKIDFDSIEWETPMPGLRYKARRHGQRQVRLVEYTPLMEPHWCEKGHVGYVLEGQFEIAFGSRIVILNPGDGIFIPPGREHRHMGKALAPVVTVVFVEEV